MWLHILGARYKVSQRKVNNLKIKELLKAAVYFPKEQSLQIKEPNLADVLVCLDCHSGIL